MRLDLDKWAEAGVLDYSALMSHLQNYKAPDRKLTTLLRSSALIRVKKGLYVLGDEYRQMPVSRELLANLIFGPSYISQEYALQYYGLIPERVETITSMTNKRKKEFDTPFGRFTYTYINTERFSEDLGFSLLEPNLAFEFNSYLNAVQTELEAFGFDTNVSLKEKNNQSAIQSAFLKSNTK